MVQEQCQPGHCEVVFRANLEMVGLEGLDRKFPWAQEEKQERNQQLNLNEVQVPEIFRSVRGG